MKAQQQVVPRENPPASTMDSRLRDFMRMNPPVYTRSKIAEDIEKEYRESMLHDSMDLLVLWYMSNKWKKSRKRKHNREGNMSTQAEETFSWKSRTEIIYKLKFVKGLSHKGESISSKGRYDRDS